MTYKCLLSVAAAVTLAACTQATIAPASTNPSCVGAAPANATIYGTWSSQQVDSLGNTTTTTMVITGSQITETTDCQYTTGLNISTVASPLSTGFTMISADAIFIPNTNTYSTPPTPDSTGVQRTCTDTLYAGSYTYALVGNCLQMTSAQTGTVDYIQ